MIIIGLMILIEDGMPIVFKQKRLGKDNKVFVFYKFRTMHRETPNTPTTEFYDAKNYIFKTGKLIRLTSLDELPNLINVLKGDMNFIGPRPSQPHEKLLNDLRDSKKVYRIKPGITGLAQVNGRDNISVESKVDYDAIYAENHNLFMDLKIFFLTFFKILNYKDIKH
jgi:O-antigen biosynthesis protein WbqP